MVKQLAYTYKAQKKYKTPQSVRQNIISTLLKSGEKGVVIDDVSDSVVYMGHKPENIEKHLETHQFVLQLKTLKGSLVAVEVFGRNRNVTLRFRKVSGMKRVRNAYAILATTENLVSHIDKDNEYLIECNESHTPNLVAFPTKSPRVTPKVVNAVLASCKHKSEYAYMMSLNIKIKNMR